MKKISALAFGILCLSTVAFSQSNSFETLKDKFKHGYDVHTFGVNGFFCRMVLGLAGEWEFKEAIRDIQHVRLIVIPSEEFANRGLSVNGFKKLLKKDSFEELASVRDHGDDVSIYLQSSGKKNRYMIVVQEPDEVVVIEMKGSIDMNLLLDKDKSLSFQNR